ncbi:MAG: Txe/YoeB family addiction module toxin [Muribaculaceae bacterium]|nr:Txe/YoeB family addiction module toxin [Muribaculaceae bacterium]
MYKVVITPDAEKDILLLARIEPKAFLKVQKLLNELKEHPKTGTGHPEPLKGFSDNRWSRRVTKKHRLIYAIYETEIVVLVFSSYGHYDDK